MKKIFLLLLTVISVTTVFAEDIKLNKIELNSDMLELLSKRSSSREYSPEKISNQQLSEILWAGFGVNRPESGKRTAGSALNKQETTIYVFKPEAVYKYDAINHKLVMVKKGNYTKYIAVQDYAKAAPVHFVLVGDVSKFDSPSAKDYVMFDSGLIAQNIVLYSRSIGIGSIIRGYIEHDNIAKLLKLDKDEIVTMSLTIGHPYK